MSDNKIPDARTVISQMIEHIVAVEAENFYFRQALSLARANMEYHATAKQFEECLAKVQAAPEQFDHFAARTRLENFHRIVDRLLPHG